MGRAIGSGRGEGNCFLGTAEQLCTRTHSGSGSMHKAWTTSEESSVKEREVGGLKSHPSLRSYQPLATFERWSVFFKVNLVG